MCFLFGRCSFFSAASLSVVVAVNLSEIFCRLTFTVAGGCPGLGEAKNQEINTSMKRYQK